MSYGLRLPELTFDEISTSEGTGGAAPHRLVVLARAAEGAGFSSLWVSDHPYRLPRAGGPTPPVLEAYTLLGCLGAVTERATLGALVTGVTDRNPAVLAKQVTALDVISRGRAILGMGAGMGAGGPDSALAGRAAPSPPPRERMDRLEEGLQICRAMLTEESPSFEGRYYQVRDAHNRPRPVNPGGPPILVGGSGPRRTLRAVARYADMCNITGSPAKVRHHLDVLAAHCAEAARDPSEITKTRLGSLYLTATREQGDRVASSMRESFGDEAVAEQMTIGDADQVGEQVLALAATGLDQLIFDLPAARSPDDLAAAGEALVAALG